MNRRRLIGTLNPAQILREEYFYLLNAASNAVIRGADHRSRGAWAKISNRVGTEHWRRDLGLRVVRVRRGS